MGQRDPFGMLDSPSCTSGLQTQPKQWVRWASGVWGIGGKRREEWRWKLAGGCAVSRERGKALASLLPPARAAGRGLGLSRRQMSAAPVGTPPPPQHTGPRTDSDLPQHQPSASSLTSWPGHSITVRPPRRTQWPVSPGTSTGGGGSGRSQLCHGCLAAPFLPSAPLCPCVRRQGAAGSQEQEGRGHGRRRSAPGTRGQRPQQQGQRGAGVPSSRAREALCKEAAAT